MVKIKGFFFKITLLLFTVNVIFSCSSENFEKESLMSFVIVKKASYSSEMLIQLKSDNLNPSSNWLLADNAGWVVEKLVKNGDYINAGQTILRLDPRDLRLSDSSARYQYEAAKATLKAHRADFLRFSELKTKKFISDAEWERRKAQLSVFEADFEELADKLGVISVRAFGNGKVKNLSVKEGELLKAGEKVAQLLLTKKITPKGYKSKVQNQVSSKSGIKIPISALIDGKVVFKVLHKPLNEQTRSGTGIVKGIKVTTGNIDESSVLITNGLSEGDVYVVSGAHLLTENQEVRFSY